MRSAFVTIEAIIAFIILTFGILTTTSSMKTLGLLNQKKAYYEELYTAVLSLKDLTDVYSFEQQKEYRGELNGFTYRINAQEIDKRRDRIFDYDSGQKVDGVYEVTLYKVVLHIRKNKLEREYAYYTARQKKYEQK